MGENSGSRSGRESPSKIEISGIEIAWDVGKGTATFENLPVAMMWVDTTLAGLMSGLQSMVGPERFRLAVQSEGRRSVEADWQVISQFREFKDGFKAIARVAAVAGWGEWNLVSIDTENMQCVFQVINSWEGRYQAALGVSWGSGMLAGKFAGYCSKLFGTNCWADQTKFIADGDPYDEFVVGPSEKTVEDEVSKLLLSDQATRADMAVALKSLELEIEERERTEQALRESENRYRHLIDGAIDLIYRTDRNGFFTMANPVALAVSGYSEDEFLGRHYLDLIAPEHRADAERFYGIQLVKKIPNTY